MPGRLVYELLIGLWSFVRWLASGYSEVTGSGLCLDALLIMQIYDDDDDGWVQSIERETFLDYQYDKNQLK